MNVWMRRMVGLLALASAVTALACTDDTVEDTSADFCESVVELRRDAAEISAGTPETTTVGEFQDSVRQVADDLDDARAALEDLDEALADEVADAHAELERSLDEVSDDMSLTEARAVVNAAVEQMDASLEAAAAQVECPAPSN